MQTLDVLRYGHEMVESTVARYGPSDWSRIALGVWTSKDLLGHLGVFEVRIADVLAGFVGVPALTDLMSADSRTFNDDQAAIRKDWPLERVLEEYLEAYERLMSHARLITPERWREVGTIPWYGPEYSLEDLVVYQMYGHKREHDPQLSAVLEAREVSPAGPG
jgi:mycothiol maleylpyruvate isomerase-like protein